MQDQMHLVDTLLARGEIKRAEMLVAKRLRLHLSPSERAKTLICRARARLAGLRPEEAIDDLANARALLPQEFDKPETLELEADCYFARFELASVGFADRGDTAQARGIYEHVIETYPYYDNLGWVYYQLGRLALTDSNSEAAENYFRQALFAPSHLKTLTAFCYERLGFIGFYERRDLNDALGFLSKAVDTYPASEKRGWLVQVHLLRSKVLREMRDYKKALAAAEIALHISSGNRPEDRHNMAEALLAAGELLSGLEGRDKDTVPYLQQFLQLSRKPLGVDVTWSRVHEMLGDAYFRLGQYDLAGEAYHAALDYNPYHPWEISLHYRIARSRYLQGQYEAAITAVQHMLNAAEVEGEHVDDYRVFDILGNAQFALGKYTDAVQSYSKALQMAPLNADNLDKIKTYYDYAQRLS